MIEYSESANHPDLHSTTEWEILLDDEEFAIDSAGDLSAGDPYAVDLYEVTGAHDEPRHWAVKESNDYGQWYATVYDDCDTARYYFERLSEGLA